MSKTDKIYYIDRRTKETKLEKVYCGPFLRFLYSTLLGKQLVNCLAYFPYFSRLVGWWQRRPWTKRKIAHFIHNYGIDSTEFEQKVTDYGSFDAFFTRKLKREARPLGEGPIIPADGRYLFHQDLSRADGFVVKGKKFSLEKLLRSPSLAEKYSEGSLLIARLCPTDYHRFHFPVDCTPGPAQLINGSLFSVNPIAVKQNIEIFTENKRMMTALQTEKFGTILFIEVGATAVGAIHQTFHPGKAYKKGDEKGYFSFGGSSLMLLFEKEKIHFASDLLASSAQYTEILCLMGQPLERAI